MNLPSPATRGGGTARPAAEPPRPSAIQDVLSRNLPDYQAQIDTLRRQVSETLSTTHEAWRVLATAQTAAVPLSQRLTSRKLWAFLAGLLVTIGTALTTATATNVDGSVNLIATLVAVAVQVSTYIAGQAAEDRAAQQSRGQIQSAALMSRPRGPKE